MNCGELYAWNDEIAKHFGRLSKPQVFNLAAFSRGVIEARDCRLALVAEALGILGQASSVERRLQRFLANEHLTAAKAQRDWASWLIWKARRWCCWWMKPNWAFIWER
jgi:hypothetical protein